MDNKKYYNVINDRHETFWSFSYQINWNVSAISGELSANGYILQHFKRIANPPQPLLEDTEYYEAWKVTSGACDWVRGQYCDDEFTVGNPLSSCEDIHNCLGTKGMFTILADVYWIPMSSDLYRIVDNWSPTKVRQANGLKADYIFPELTREYFVFTRPTYKHEWNFIDTDLVDRTVRKLVFRKFPKSTDNQLLSNDLNEIFDGSEQRYFVLKEVIYKDWNNQWLEGNSKDKNDDRHPQDDFK